MLLERKVRVIAAEHGHGNPGRFPLAENFSPHHAPVGLRATAGYPAASIPSAITDAVQDFPTPRFARMAMVCVTVLPLLKRIEASAPSRRGGAHSIKNRGR